MSDTVKYIVVLDNAQALRGFVDMENAANKTESSINGMNAALRNIGGALGVGFGLRQLLDFGKDAVQGAADYETAVKRIKFSSNTLKEGWDNIAFIGAEADRFRIPLQQATDDYGKFLAQVAGSGMATEQVQHLHDELLMIGKIKGLDMGQLSAGVMNLGKMLEAGAMDARHLRPLEQQLSGIGKFIADELGTTVHHLAQLRNKGKLTDIDPVVLLRAIEKQAKSLEQFLPESLTTIQSEINDVGNAWLRFKNDLVFENRDELQGLFNTLREGISWLRDNEGVILGVGKAVFSLGKAWIEYKGIMMLLNTASSTYRAFMAGYAGEAAVVTGAVTGQAAAYNGLAAAMERLNIASSFGGAYGVGAYGTPLLAAGGGNAAGAISGATKGAAAGLLAGLGSAVAPVAVVAIAANVLNELFPQRNVDGSVMSTSEAWSPIWGFYQSGLMMDAIKDARAHGATDDDIDWLKENGFYNQYNKLNLGSGAVSKEAQDINLEALGVKDPMYNPFFDKKKFAGYHDDKNTKIVPPKDKVTGQHVTNYNIKIDRLTGIEKNTVENGKDFDVKKIGDAVMQELIDAMNDSQLR